MRSQAVYIHKKLSNVFQLIYHRIAKYERKFRHDVENNAQPEPPPTAHPLEFLPPRHSAGLAITNLEPSQDHDTASDFVHNSHEQSHVHLAGRSKAQRPVSAQQGRVTEDIRQSDTFGESRPNASRKFWTADQTTESLRGSVDPNNVASIQARKARLLAAPVSSISPMRSRPQPETRPISQEQLVAEVKGIYAGLVMVEARCIEVDKRHAKLEPGSPNSSLQPKISHQQWQALIALHRTLLHEHHDFFLASQHPSASPALRKLAAKYAMPARMWRHGIQSFLELLRHRLPAALDHMLSFIYLAYSMMALLYEAVPTFGDTWIECLGELARYRMAIEEEDDIRDREVKTGAARPWHSTASDKSSTAEGYHHSAVLAPRHGENHNDQGLRDAQAVKRRYRYTTASMQNIKSSSARGVRGTVNGQAVIAFCDTGAGQNILSAQYAQEMDLKIDPQPQLLRMANSQQVATLGTVTFPWTFEDDPNNVIHVVAHVLQNFKYDCLLGNPFIRSTALMTKHLHRFVKGAFQPRDSWSMNLLGESSQRVQGMLGDDVCMEGLPDIGSARNVMDEAWAISKGFSILSHPDNCGVIEFPDNSTRKTVGQVHTTITLPGGESIPIVFEVLPDCYVPVVLGVDFVFDNDLFIEHADAIHEAVGFDCTYDLMGMDYYKIEKATGASLGDRIKILLWPRHRQSSKSVKQTRLSPKLSNESTELNRQHEWDQRYNYGRDADQAEWDSELQRRESHELQQFPDWKPNVLKPLVKHKPIHKPDPGV